MDIEIKKEQIPLILIIALGIFFIYLASQTQMLGEDEAPYYYLGKEFSQLEYASHDAAGTPMVLMPFMSLVYAIPFTIFGPSLSLAKIVITLFGILTLFVVYLIGKKTNMYYGLISASLLLSITLFTHYMFISYQEVPIAFFSALVTLMFLTMDSTKKALLTGIIMSMAFYTKQSALIFFPILFLYAIFLHFYKKDKKYLKLSIITIGIALVMMSPYVIRNLLLYSYPYTQIINTLFKAPSVIQWEGISGKVLSPLITSIGGFASSFGWLIVLSTIFGFSWIIVDAKKNKLSNELFLFALISLLLVASYYVFYFLDLQTVEPRYLSIIFPQLSLIGGFFLWKTKEKNKYFLILIGLVIVASLYSSIITAISTSSSQRYPNNYIEALTWIKQNTDESSIVMSTYTGSARYFSDRNVIWAMNETQKMMSTSDSTYIHDVLKKYDVSYILIWRGVIGQDFIIPESNLYGVFTYSFLDTIVNDTQRFNVTYQNQDNIILKVN